MPTPNAEFKCSLQLLKDSAPQIYEAYKEAGRCQHRTPSSSAVAASERFSPTDCNSYCPQGKREQGIHSKEIRVGLKHPPT